MTTLNQFFGYATLARVACLSFILGATSAHAQPPIFITNGEVNTTSAIFNNWVLVDNLDFTDPATFTTLIVNSPAEFNGANNQDTSIVILANSILEFNGGTVSEDIDFNEASIGIFNGGLVEDDIYVYDDSTVTINDLTLQDDLEAYDDSMVTINGGTFVEDIEAFGNSSILITGGNLGARVRTFGNSEISIFGRNFALDGTRVYTGDQLTSGGTLTGILRDGTEFSVQLDVGGGAGDNSLVIVPEPATGLLLLLGGTALALRRRQR